ncbi:MAG: efflux RND transporter periplasmic adaptor subunit [Sphingomonadaceae bacterium]|nr:efflux RND transporter periplasmic adaptor subunit [Sphingomonadaceae bacterium]MCP5392323.1 efflux RND transporter periplasmic adaptor subunit [Sphingomonadaceae bacterium]
MNITTMQRRKVALIAVLVILAVSLGYVALRSGPLAPVAVTTADVENRTLRPALFGVGTIDAERIYHVGPTFAGRVRRLTVNVGDRVVAGQLIGEMDPVDLDDRLSAQVSAVRGAETSVSEANARRTHAAAEADRYESLLEARATSEEVLAAKRQDLVVAEAAAATARSNLDRMRSDYAGLQSQRGNLRLVAPATGIVSLREVEPGAAVAGGQTVIEIIDPASLWVNVRFDQVSSAGLMAGLPARVQLRSRDGEVLRGRVLRIEPRADAVTEETLVKVVFDTLPVPLPPLGEYVEVTVDLAPLPDGPVVPNAAVRRQGDSIGVWRLEDGEPVFVPVTPGKSDLDGQVQILRGLSEGDTIIVYSERELSVSSSISIVERIPGVTP